MEQAGCPGLREYQRETLDGIARRRASGQPQSEIADRLDPRVTAYIAKLLRDKGC